MGLSNKIKTMICVALAGMLFVPAVILNLWYLAIVGAFFDWLPLPTGWMKMGGNNDKRMIIIHVVLTLVAYSFLLLWLMFPVTTYKFLFFEIWWIAVITGVSSSR